MATVGWDFGRTKTLPIVEDAQLSDVLDLGSDGRRAAYTVAVIAAAALTGIVTIEVSHSAGGPFADLQSDGVDVTLTAGKAAVLDPFPFPYLRLSSSLAEAADRNFIVMAVGAA